MRLILTVMLALMTLAACGQNSQSNKAMNQKETEQQITMLYERMYRLMIQKDVKALGAMLSDDFELVHMTGMHQPKAVYLKAIADGTLNYYKAETENIIFDSICIIPAAFSRKKASFHGLHLHGISDNKAVITGQSRVNAAVFGGGKYTWPLQLRISLEQRDGQWIMTKAVASTY